MGNNNDIEKDIIDSSEELVVLEEKRAKVRLADVGEKASKAGKKAMQLASVMLAQTASGSKVLADGIAKGTKDFSEKAKIDSYNRRMKKYNPLFVEEYSSPDFLCLILLV